MVWVISLVAIGYILGYFMKVQVNTWYKTLKRSPLTPPSYVFGVVWTLLYVMIGTAGWFLWSYKKHKMLKNLYIIQLILNGIWSPTFFNSHSILPSFISIIINTLVVNTLVFLSFSKIRTVSLMLLPYMCWLLFATYLNFYIWYFN